MTFKINVYIYATITQFSVKTFLSLPQIPAKPSAVNPCSQPLLQATTHLLPVSDIPLNSLIHSHIIHSVI